MEFDEGNGEVIRTPANLVYSIRQCLRNRGAYGIRGLANLFKSFDTDGSGQVGFEEFKWGMKKYGLELNVQENVALFRHFDKNGNGSLDTKEFISTIRGACDPARKEVICAAWKRVSGGADSVTLEEVLAHFNAFRHPQVIKGYQTKNEVFSEFIKMWDKDMDATITMCEFGNYFMDLSAAI